MTPDLSIVIADKVNKYLSKTGKFRTDVKKTVETSNNLFKDFIDYLKTNEVNSLEDFPKKFNSILK